MDELRKKLRFILPVVVLLVTACADGQAAASGASLSGSVVDSILDPETAVARFLDGSAKPTRLDGGAKSADALVAELFDAVRRADSAAVNDLLINRVEYGTFYYPTSVYSSKPYELPPEVAWMLSSEGSAKGARRLISRLGQNDLRLHGYRCKRVEKQGENEISSQCTVIYTLGDGARQERSLFRSILVHEGTAKFLSLAGDF